MNGEQVERREGDERDADEQSEQAVYWVRRGLYLFQSFWSCGRQYCGSSGKDSRNVNGDVSYIRSGRSGYLWFLLQLCTPEMKIQTIKTRIWTSFAKRWKMSAAFFISRPRVGIHLSKSPIARRIGWIQRVREWARKLSLEWVTKKDMKQPKVSLPIKRTTYLQTSLKSAKKIYQHFIDRG